MTVFAGSWRWQQESGSWRNAPSALSREFPAVMWSNRPSWAPHAVSLVHSPSDYHSWGSVLCVMFFVLCAFERLPAGNKSTENLSVNDSETPDTPKSNRSGIRSVVNGARRRGWVAQIRKLITENGHKQINKCNLCSESWCVAHRPKHLWNFLLCSAEVQAALLSKCWQYSVWIDIMQDSNIYRITKKK